MYIETQISYVPVRCFAILWTLTWTLTTLLLVIFTSLTGLQVVKETRRYNRGRCEHSHPPCPLPPPPSGLCSKTKCLSSLHVQYPNDYKFEFLLNTTICHSLTFTSSMVLTTWKKDSSDCYPSPLCRSKIDYQSCSLSAERCPGKH